MTSDLYVMLWDGKSHISPALLGCLQHLPLDITAIDYHCHYILQINKVLV